MKRQVPIPGRFIPPTAIKGERDAEIGRRIEKGQPTDPLGRTKHLAKQQQSQDWKLKLEELEQKDKAESGKQIQQVTQFLKEVSAEERRRQEEMRQRIEEILENKLKGVKRADSEAGLPPLVEPSAKPKRGGFIAKLKQKGKSAMAEAKGMVVKGGG